MKRWGRVFNMMFLFCAVLAISHAKAMADPQCLSQKDIVVIGTVTYIPRLELGFWGIVGDDGKKYKPFDLPKELQKTGLRAKFVLKPRPDIFTTTIWGKTFEIKTYQILSETQK